LRTRAPRESRTAAAGLVSVGTGPVCGVPLAEPALPGPPGLLARFAAQVERNPTAPAVLCGARQLTYGELAGRAAALARRLRCRGAGIESLVLLSTGRSPELVVGLLGILASGAAYVPIDPDHPEERLRLLREDVGARLAVADAAGRRAAGPVEIVDPALPEGGTEPWGALPFAGEGAPAAALAYVLFTSGSTGRPKGVAVSRGSLAAALAALERRLGLGPADRFLAVTRLSFDIAALEILLPLLVGGSVVLADPAAAADGALLLRELQANGCTVLQGTPATWRMLLDAEGRPPRGLKLLCGGETLPEDLAARLTALGGAAWNLYGPTEATIWSTAARLEAGREVTLGVALDSARATLLDGVLEALPAGEAGELGLGGPAVARGYLGRPDLTAERFVPDAWSDVPGARLYRTGDRCRLRADGQLAMLGRLDGQVKLRGHRIEPGEIESVLCRHPGVGEAAVALREVRPGDAALVAWLVPRPGAAADAAALRGFLADRLPAAMIPAFFVRLAALPLTPNRKLDRSALPLPEVRPAAGEAPRGLAEERLAGIWAEVLGVASVGRHEDFFALGGHSLLAGQLLRRVRETCGREVSLTGLLGAPTVAALAAELERHAAPIEYIEPLPGWTAEPERAEEPFPLTEVQEAYWIGRGVGFELGGIAAHEYLEVDCEGLDLGRLARAWERLAARHGMLRATFLPDGRQRIEPCGPAARIEVEELDPSMNGAAGDRLAAIRRALSHRAGATQRPLFEIRATGLGAGGHRLHLSLDLIAGDAQSLRTLAADLVRLYQTPEEPPPLTLSFRDHVLADLRLRGGPRAERARAYWRRCLPGLPAAPELPLARRPVELGSPRFERRATRLAPEVWQRLRERAAGHGLAPVALLLAAYCDVLACWSRSPVFTLNLPVSRRPAVHPDGERLVGDFTLLLPLAVDPRPGAGFAERARRLQERLWQHLDHGGVGGVELLRELARVQGVQAAAALPVVFTSLLGLAGADPAESLAALGRVVYRVTQTPQVALDHLVSDEAGELVVAWDAVEELFPPGVLDDMAAAHRRLLLRLAGEEDAWEETAFSLVPAAQLAVRARENETAQPLPEAPLQALVAAQARRSPDATALVSGGRRLSYRELQARATAVACWLRDRGAGPDRLVAVVMDKGWEQVVAVLAVLEAGGAYLPIDPALPAARRRALLADGEVALVLSQERLAATLDLPAGLQLLAVDTAEPADAPPLAPVQEPGHLAWVLYTSGSTGRPKGVMITHCGAVNAVLDAVRRFGLSSRDRVLGLTSLDHDMSVFDLFATLAAGGTLVLPEAWGTRDPGHWEELMQREGVTVWSSVPTFLEMLLAHLDGRLALAPAALASAALAPAALRLCLLGGDWIPLPLAERLRRLCPGAALVSVGGPTETTLWNICHPVGEIDPSWRSIPYGRPTANNRYHVLDESLAERPVWVAGELCCGGAGVARGYWRDPARTGERFVAHPETGERIYRTGDLGRYLPDGTIEILGRLDFQVKLQGRRIELGEIEAALREHPAVRAAAVAVAESPAGRRLVGYVVPVPQAPEPDWLGALDAPLADPAERAAFKLQAPGLRGFAAPRPEVALELPPPGPELRELWAGRRSYRRFAPGPVPLARVSQLLAALLQIDLEGLPVPKARYPSGGGLYPVQAYVYVPPGRVEGLAAGTWYYHPRTHRLVEIDPAARLGAGLHTPPNRTIFAASAFSLFLVARYDAVRPMYGGLARDLCLLEAGYMGQLLMAAAPPLGLGLCPVGFFSGEALRSALALDEGYEVLHGFLGGAIEASQATAEGLVREAALAAGPGNGDGLAAALRSFLRERLPAHMVPASFVTLGELPRTASGKLDRRALPAPEEGGPPPAVPPSSAAERAIAAAWQAIAGGGPPGLHDNFFDAGGTSLHVVQLNRRLREVFGRDIPIVEMFRRPNVAALAGYLAEGGDGEAPVQGVEERAERLRRGAARVRALYERAQEETGG
jgi:amino acid adenylation domain-containing protein